MSKEGNNCSVANFLHIVRRIPSWSHAGVNQYQDQINQLFEKPAAGATDGAIFSHSQCHLTNQTINSLKINIVVLYWFNCYLMGCRFNYWPVQSTLSTKHHRPRVHFITAFDQIWRTGNLMTIKSENNKELNWINKIKNLLGPLPSFPAPFTSLHYRD